MGWSTAGKFGCAVLFPGDDASGVKPAVDDGTANLPSGPFTVEWWIKRTYQPCVGAIR